MDEKYPVAWLAAVDDAMECGGQGEAYEEWHALRQAASDLAGLGKYYMPPSAK